jgi:hypothetical protein
LSLRRSECGPGGILRRYHVRRNSVKQSLRIPHKLAKVRSSEFDDDTLPLPLDTDSDTFAVIEVTGLDEETMEPEPAERTDRYAKYVPQRDGIRVIGRSSQHAVGLDCSDESSDLADFTISINHDCDGWLISFESQSSTSLFATSGSSSTK